MERKRDFKPCVLWVGGDAFVQIVDIKLKSLKSDLLLEIKVINKLHSMLTKIEYDVFFYDSGDIKLNEEKIHISGDDVNIGQNEIAVASNYDIGKRYPNARRAEVKIVKAHFDGNKSIELEYENMEKFAINDLEDKDIKLLKKAAGDDAMCLPAKLTMNWRCVCGYFNGDESEFCNNCSREKNQVLSDYRSIEYIREKIEKELLSQIDVDIDVKTQEEPPVKEVEIKEEKIEDTAVIEEVKEEKIKDDKVLKKEKIDIKGELKTFLSNSNKRILVVLFMAGVFFTSSIFIFFSRL